MKKILILIVGLNLVSCSSFNKSKPSISPQLQKMEKKQYVMIKNKLKRGIAQEESIPEYVIEADNPDYLKEQADLQQNEQNDQKQLEMEQHQMDQEDYQVAGDNNY